MTPITYLQEKYLSAYYGCGKNKISHTPNTLIIYNMLIPIMR